MNDKKLTIGLTFEDTEGDEKDVRVAATILAAFAPGGRTSAQCWDSAYLAAKAVREGRK